jgi:hypothetical protein
VTSCNATRSKLVFANSLATVSSESILQTSNISYYKSRINFSLPGSFQRIHPIPNSWLKFHNKLQFYGEDLIAPRPTSKLEDHPLLTVNTYPLYLDAVPHSQSEEAASNNVITANRLLPK